GIMAETGRRAGDTGPGGAGAPRRRGGGVQGTRRGEDDTAPGGAGAPPRRGGGVQGTRRGEDAVADVRAWLEDNWDPDLTVGEWWDRLGTSGWAAPTWPVEWFGRGLSREEGVRVQAAVAGSGALGAPGGLGLLLAGPTIVAHGSDEQKERYLRDIVTGPQAWCQLFSEPGA